MQSRGRERWCPPMERDVARYGCAVQGECSIRGKSDTAEGNDKFTNYGDIVYGPATLFIKMSINLLVVRIFTPRSSDRLWWLLQGLNAAMVIFYALQFFIPLFQCNPRDKIWDPFHPGHCQYPSSIHYYMLFQHSD